MNKYHDLSDMSPEAAYSATQYGFVYDGDIMVLPNGAVAVMVSAWPVMVVGSCEGFHELEGINWDKFEGGKYLQTVNNILNQDLIEF